MPDQAETAVRCVDLSAAERDGARLLATLRRVLGHPYPTPWPTGDEVRAAMALHGMDAALKPDPVRPVREAVARNWL